MLFEIVFKMCISTQENILIACVPPACQPYVCVGGGGVTLQGAVESSWEGRGLWSLCSEVQVRCGLGGSLRAQPPLTLGFEAPKFSIFRPYLNFP